MTNSTDGELDIYLANINYLNQLWAKLRECERKGSSLRLTMQHNLETDNKVTFQDLIHYESLHGPWLAGQLVRARRSELSPIEELSRPASKTPRVSEQKVMAAPAAVPGKTQFSRTSAQRTDYGVFDYTRFRSVNKKEEEETDRNRSRFATSVQGSSSSSELSVKPYLAEKPQQDKDIQVNVFSLPVKESQSNQTAATDGFQSAGIQTVPLPTPESPEHTPTPMRRFAHLHVNRAVSKQESEPPLLTESFSSSMPKIEENRTNLLVGSLSDIHPPYRYSSRSGPIDEEVQVNLTAANKSVRVQVDSRIIQTMQPRMRHSVLSVQLRHRGMQTRTNGAIRSNSNKTRSLPRVRKFEGQNLY